MKNSTISLNAAGDYRNYSGADANVTAAKRKKSKLTAKIVKVAESENFVLTVWTVCAVVVLCGAAMGSGAVMGAGVIVMTGAATPLFLRWLREESGKEDEL